jgi:thymidylate synthase
MTYLAIPTAFSCSQAWVAATQAVTAAGHTAHNVVLDVLHPIDSAPLELELQARVNRFLIEHNKNPIQTVANTIFPQWTYDRYGSPEFYEVYLAKVFPRTRTSHSDWGRYFERMLRFPVERKGTAVRPLPEMVEKIRRQIDGPKCYGNVYEITIYDPVRDANPVMNRQCLSFLSFKVTADEPRQLLLTAIYRNHYYIQRLLGNLVGLGRLMNFVAIETGLRVGPLTVVSTHAEVERVGSRALVKRLVEECDAIIRSSVGRDG